MEESRETSVEDRIRRVENGVVPLAPVWSETGEVSTLAERMGFYMTPGLGVAVINGGGVEWSRGYGALEAGGDEPVTEGTIFQACSISKHVALLGVLRLAQEGVLDLEEDANSYLKSWKIPPNGSWQPRVTVRHLLGHTAGLTSNWYPGYRRGEPTPTLLQTLESAPPANTPTVRVVLLPGTRFRYSGAHYSVLQQLLVDVAGAPFAELMRGLVFEPLGMRNSSYDQAYPEGRLGSTARGHHRDGGPLRGGWRAQPEMAGAGLWATPSDLARLELEIQRAHRGLPTAFLSKGMADLALTPQIDESFGLGTELKGRGGDRRFGHGGDNIGYKCLSEAYAERGLGAVIMANADEGIWAAVELLNAVAREYRWPGFAGLGYDEERDSRSRPDPVVHDAYAGGYELRPGTTLTVGRRGGDLVILLPGQEPVGLEPLSGEVFRTREANCEIAFERNGEGDVSGLVLRQEGQEDRARKLR